MGFFKNGKATTLDLKNEIDYLLGQSTHPDDRTRVHIAVVEGLHKKVADFPQSAEWIKTDKDGLRTFIAEKLEHLIRTNDLNPEYAGYFNQAAEWLNELSPGKMQAILMDKNNPEKAQSLHATLLGAPAEKELITPRRRVIPPAPSWGESVIDVGAGIPGNKR